MTLVQSSSFMLDLPKPKNHDSPPCPSYPRGGHEKVMLEGFHNMVSKVHNQVVL